MNYNISKVQLDKWQQLRWDRDNVSEIITQNGFIFKPAGRSGTIYFSESGKLCEIYVEMAGVSKYDMLIFFNNLNWYLPEQKPLTRRETADLKVKLVKWLNEQNIKSDLNSDN